MRGRKLEEASWPGRLNYCSRAPQVSRSASKWRLNLTRCAGWKDPRLFSLCPCYVLGVDRCGRGDSMTIVGLTFFKARARNGCSAFVLRPVKLRAFVFPSGFCRQCRSELNSGPFGMCRTHFFFVVWRSVFPPRFPCCCGITAGDDAHRGVVRVLPALYFSLPFVQTGTSCRVIPTTVCIVFVEG